MKITNLNELFLHELKDLYDAEHQLVDALPKLAEAATNADLAEAFRNHLDETRQHVVRLEQVFQELGEEPDRETCKGIKGLIDEGSKMLKEDMDDDARDAAIITAAQKCEHYEIAAYGTLRIWAMTMGLNGAVEPLETTLEEEKTADLLLTEIAEAAVNLSAETEGEEGDTTPSRQSNRSRSGTKSTTGRARSSRSRNRPVKTR